MPGYPKPAFKVTLDGKDLTDRIAQRLVSLSLSEKRGGEADQLDLVIHDHDGRMAIPKRGALLSVQLGWEATGLVDKGQFRVDEVEHSGSPDQITVRARSADFTSGMEVRRHRSWRDVTLRAVLQDVAAGAGLELRVSAELASKHLDVLQQSRESDLSLLKRLGKRYDAVASVKAGRLVFTPKGGGATASGQAIPAVSITRADGDQHQYSVTERDAAEGVTASWHDLKTGERKEVSVGDGETKKHLRRTYASEAEAKAAAEAELSRMAREKVTMGYTLALGRPELFPETPVSFSGLKAEIDAVSWIVSEADHAIADGQGFTTRLQLEQAGNVTD